MMMTEQERAIWDATYAVTFSQNLALVKASGQGFDAPRRQLVATDAATTADLAVQGLRTLRRGSPEIGRWDQP